jgi:hypothetical protein
MVDRVNKELELMERKGIIERSSNSIYVSPIVVVRKKNTDEICMCVDFSKLNAISFNDPTPQHEPDDVFAKLGNAKLWSKFDTSKGYFAIPVHDSKDYLTFVSERKCYRFRSIRLDVVVQIQHIIG